MVESKKSIFLLLSESLICKIFQGMNFSDFIDSEPLSPTSISKVEKSVWYH